MTISQYKTDVLYFEAAGDVVSSLRSWSSQQQLQSETSKTFSGQFFDACHRKGMNGRVISFNRAAGAYSNGLLSATNTAILNGAAWLPFHLHMLLRSLYILMQVLLHRPRYLIVNSGVANWLALAPARLFGVKLIASLHNSLWPEGFYPRKALARARLALDALFFNSVADAVLCVSETCARQVMTLSGIGRDKLFRHVPQFVEADFPPHPSHRQFSDRPFVIVFAGRIEANKGVFDILKMAANLRQRGYVDFRFVLCGDGSAYATLQSKIFAEGLDSHVVLKGRLNRVELLNEYRAAHIAIVPTRSEFAEGFAMVALESVLLGRPVLTNPVVPAHEELGDAVILAETDDPTSYSDRIAELTDSLELYQNLCSSCHAVRERYFADANGMDRVLEQILDTSFLINEHA